MSDLFGIIFGVVLCISLVIIGFATLVMIFAFLWEIVLEEVYSAFSDMVKKRKVKRKDKVKLKKEKPSPCPYCKNNDDRSTFYMGKEIKSSYCFYCGRELGDKDG